MKKIILILILFVGGSNLYAQQVDFSSLLREMTDRTMLPKYSSEEYTCKQFSSYDRRAIDPANAKTWFANADASWFIRSETNQGRTEHVLFDAQGPGAVVRFWATMANYDGEGILRFYFDGEQTPRIEGEPRSLLSGGALTDYPLSFSVSELTPYDRRGHNLYLPIPYARSLKITYESDNVKPGPSSPEKFYYQINYRTYHASTSVESFSKEVLEASRTLLDQTRDSLYHRNRGLDGVKLTTTSLDGLLNPGQSMKKVLKGEGAVRKITMRVEAENLAQALRSTVLEIVFDGKQRVWVPVGDFFGTGYVVRPSSSWYTAVTEDGQLSCWWIMPYKDICEISLKNYGTQPVRLVSSSVSSGDWTWSDNTMHFCAVWHQLTKVQTRVSSQDNPTGAFDINFASATGRGLWLGDGLTIFNTVPKWWGEGDEKIYVDGEKLPSHFGTGTEDYYGYAWCRPEPFLHPFIQQPEGAGNFSLHRSVNAVGPSMNARFRVLDAIPFNKSIRFDMEVWHWNSCLMNYAPIAFFYLSPDGKIANKNDEEGVKAPVALSRSYFYSSVVNKGGKMLGADLKILSVSDGEASQGMFPEIGRARKLVLSWKGMKEGATLATSFEISEKGTYQMDVEYAGVPAMAQIQLLLNGEPLGFLSDNGKEVSGMKSFSMDKVVLKNGANTLEFKAVKSVNTGSLSIGEIALKKK